MPMGLYPALAESTSSNGSALEKRNGMTVRCMDQLEQLVGVDAGRRNFQNAVVVVGVCSDWFIYKTSASIQETGANRFRRHRDIWNGLTMELGHMRSTVEQTLERLLMVISWMVRTTKILCVISVGYINITRNT